MSENQNITEIAKKQRYSYLLNKIKSGKALSPAEIKELDKFEKMAKKKTKPETKTTQVAAGRKFILNQQKFIDAYNGNIKEASKKTGLSYQYCRRLATKSNVLEAIKNRQNTEVRPGTIANRQARQKFWTKVMDDEAEETKDRLKASELLGRSEADFTDNIKHSGSIMDEETVLKIQKKLEKRFSAYAKGEL
jgi:hypothetical protein